MFKKIDRKILAGIATSLILGLASLYFYQK